MKRYKPLRSSVPLKRTPLVRRTPLVPQRLPGARATTLARSAIAPMSEKRRRANAKRAVVVSAMREAVAGRCARCGRADMPVFGHERLARAHSGDILQPDCLLCNPCNGWAEDEPRAAAFTGWKISGKHPHDPLLEIGTARALDGSIVTFAVYDEDVA